MKPRERELDGVPLFFQSVISRHFPVAPPCMQRLPAGVLLVLISLGLSVPRASAAFLANSAAAVRARELLLCPHPRLPHRTLAVRAAMAAPKTSRVVIVPGNGEQR